nr:hypothetical protein [Salinicola tamaricis]
MCLPRLTLLPLLLVATGALAADAQYGADPQLPEPQRGLLPNMGVPEQTPWNERKPEVPEGYTITTIATDLQVPRQTLVLPNGDILVAEGKGGGNAPKVRPKDFIAGLIQSQGTTAVKSGDRLTLLRATPMAMAPTSSRRCSPTASTRPTAWRWWATTFTSPIRTRWCASTISRARPPPAAPPRR